MAGYSGTPLAKKLGILDGTRVLFVDAPRGFAKTVDCTFVTAKKDPDVIVFFVTAKSKLKLSGHGKAIFPYGSVWIAWPKKSSGVETDMTEDVIRAVALPMGLVDNKVCAIDDTWSGLRLVWRKDRR